MSEATASPVWCRMNDCYRTTQTDSDFCHQHGWWQPNLQNVEREPQADSRTPRTPASSRPNAAESSGPASRSAQLTDHLHNQLRKRIGSRLAEGRLA